jgi:ATP-binding cassette subfamily A (ABC1) protein 3
VPFPNEVCPVQAKLYFGLCRKRNLWRTLRRIAPGKAVVVATHSMEEATALSTNVGIISRRLLAVGTVQSLAARYPLYEVQFSARTREELQRAQDMMKAVPGAKMADDVTARFEVEIPLRSAGPDEGTSGATPLTLALLFALLSAQDPFTEFSVNRMGLENIFLKVIGENPVIEEGESKRAWWRLF